MEAGFAAGDELEETKNQKVPATAAAMEQRSGVRTTALEDRSSSNERQNSSSRIRMTKGIQEVLEVQFESD